MLPVKGSESAALQALSIPEIVANVLYHVWSEYRDNEDGTIFAATLTSSLWSSEANRHLWEFCGDQGYKSYHPAVRDLMAIEPQRRQHYASLIRVMWISDQDHRRSDTNIWEGQYHSRLAHLSFPRLEELTMTGPFDRDQDSSKFDNLPITQYLQARLRSLTVVDWNGLMRPSLTDDFFLELGSRCKALKELNLPLSHDNHIVSSKNFERMVLDLSHLSALTLGSGLSGCMSSTTFTNLARAPSLMFLDIPNIQESWVEAIVSGVQMPQAPFTSLLSLHCELSSLTLGKLLPSMTRLWKLSVIAAAGSTGMFAIIAHSGLEELEEVHLQPCRETVIHAQDLVILAQRAKQLSTIDIASSFPDDEADLPTVQGLDDSLMEKLAACSPKLEDFSLGFRQEGCTEQSLISLGRHCPELKSVMLTATMDYQNLTRADPTVSWPGLLSITINSPYREAGAAGQDDLERPADFRTLAKDMLRAMPSLSIHSLFDNVELDRTLGDLVDSMQGIEEGADQTMEDRNNALQET